MATLSFSAGCVDRPGAESSGSPTPSPSASTTGSRPSAGPTRLRIDGTRFVRADGRPFEWRGITAFRLVDHVADGQEAQAAAFLKWAASQGLTIVRVLTMMGGQFDLRPDDGLRALPRLLELAATQGLYVEVVALAGTADIPVNLKAHVGAIGRILGEHPNGVLEIANEPVHPSQSAEVQDPAVLQSLAALVPREIPISLGSIERGEGFGAGSYITWHAPRDSGPDGWRHVHALAEGATLIGKWRKPVVSDEPIGAGSVVQPGRRDNDPARFRAAALVTRLAGLGATFHYEGGIQARVPEGRELECLAAWNEGWTLLPPSVEGDGIFRANAAPGSIVASHDRERITGVYERSTNSAGWILVLGDAAAPVTLEHSWVVRETRRFDGGRLLNVARQAGTS